MVETATGTPYPVAEFDTITLPSLLMVKEADALYVRENVSDDAQALLEVAFLFVQWAVDTMREVHGAAAGVKLTRGLMHCLNQPEPIGEGDAS